MDQGALRLSWANPPGDIKAIQPLPSPLWGAGCGRREGTQQDVPFDLFMVAVSEGKAIILPLCQEEVETQREWGSFTQGLQFLLLFLLQQKTLLVMALPTWKPPQSVASSTKVSGWMEKHIHHALVPSWWYPELACAEARPAFCLETTDSNDVLEEAGLSVMTERQKVSNKLPFCFLGYNASRLKRWGDWSHNI